MANDEAREKLAKILIYELRYIEKTEVDRADAILTAIEKGEVPGVGVCEGCKKKDAYEDICTICGGPMKWVGEVNDIHKCTRCGCTA